MFPAKFVAAQACGCRKKIDFISLSTYYIFTSKNSSRLEGAEPNDLEGFNEMTQAELDEISGDELVRPGTLESLAPR